MTLEELLIRDEGLRLMPYQDDVGVWTIGIGRAIGRVGISHEEALSLLRNDIARVKKELTLALPWYRTLSPIRQMVLESMCFNLGLVGLLKFTRTLAAIQAGDYATAADHMLASRWAHQVKRRAVRLATMMREDREIL